jgi:hypothetical protein
VKRNCDGAKAVPYGTTVRTVLLQEYFSMAIYIYICIYMYEFL